MLELVAVVRVETSVWYKRTARQAANKATSTPSL